MPLAVALALGAAGVATLVLHPREGQIEPASVDPRAYFSDAELARAEDFRGPQRVLALTNIALSGAVLVLVAVRPPRGLRRKLQGGRPYRTAAAAGAGFSVAIALVSLPVAAISHERARDVGLATQDWPAWLADGAKSDAISALFAAGGATLALALVRRFPRRWWIGGAGAVVGLSVLFTYIGPVVLAPIFNKFEPLPPGQLRSDVLDLAKRSDVDVGQVYRIDASRRTTGINAYVNGIGHTKRVVLYDNLIDRFPRDEVDSVVAHELGHVRHNDVPRGLLWLAIVAPAATLLVQRLSEKIAPADAHLGDRQANALALPALAVSMALVSFAAGVASNDLSRSIERSADSYALNLTDNPAAFIEVERRLAVDNVGDPDPPGWVQLLFGTHPTTIDRIGAALTWSREQGR